jgi:hypothetical protein
MSDLLEVISISSGDTSTQVTPAVILSLVSNALFHSPASFEHCIDANELNAWLSECPPTKYKQTKKNWEGTQKYKYRRCSCGDPLQGNTASTES